LLAGHETTATALAWAFAHAASGHETADPQHIFSEALRLHPAIWVIERRAIGPDRIGGYDIPEGSSVLVCPYLLHRDAAFWPDPERFDPTRFDPQREEARPRHAYLPFGLGQHRCIGLHLARLIAQNMLTTVFDQVRLQLVPGQTLGHTPGITLRPSTPIMMAVSPRV
jgi:enediyne biosynthesis protein E7